MIKVLIASLLIVFIAVVLIRTFKFKSEDITHINNENINFDGDAAIKNLQKLIKCKTISYYDHNLEDNKEFSKLTRLLPKLYPNVHKKLDLIKFDGRGLLYHWKGKEKGSPAVFMAHYDVVPVQEDKWSKPPFEGLIEDEIMWGRGTLDTKVSFNGILFAAEELIKKGFTPKHDIYFAFSGGEEVYGPGAINIANYFKEKGITPSFVLDEGGAVISNVFPGLNKKCGFIGIAEKGYVDMTLSVETSGGHSSAPKPHTPVGILSKACARIEAHPFKMKMSEPAFKMFDTLGRKSSFIYRMIFANLWCFAWILDIVCRINGGQINALLRTTCAFTQMSGSDTANVISPSASMTANIRINPNDSIDSTINRIKKIINNPQINISLSSPIEPSKVSITDCNEYRIIANAIEDTWLGCITSPYLMVQGSDSIHYCDLCDKVYRFSATDLTDDEMDSIHGNDEHIRLETIKKAVEFFIRVMKNC